MAKAKKKTRKSMRLSKPLQKMLAQNEERFKDLMYREPVGGDRLLFETYFQSLTEQRRDAIRVMIATGLNPSLIYVYDKTGFMPSEMNKDKFSEEENIEIDEVFDEFYENESELEYNPDEYNDNDFRNAMDLTVALYVFGNYIDRNFNNNIK